MNIDQIRFEQLEIHPEILSRINVDAMEWLFTNNLTQDALVDQLDLKPIPVILKKRCRKNAVYQVIGSLNEYLALIKIANYRSDLIVPIHVLDSFNLRQSLNSIAYDIWGKKGGSAANTVSASLFLEQGKVRRKESLPVMLSEHITSKTDSNAGRIRCATGFDNRGRATKKVVSLLPDNVRDFVASLLNVSLKTANDGADDGEI